MANNHDQQPQHTYSSFTRGGTVRGRGRGRGRGENVAVNCWECGEPGHISRNCPVRNYAWRANRASSSDPSKADAVESASGTPNVRAKPMNTSTEDSSNVEPAKVWLPQKNVNINPLLATIEQKEKELELCGQKIDTLNSQLNKATTDLKCARAKNENIAINVNSLQQELEQCRKELSSLKDKDKAWAKNYRCLNEDMAGNMNKHEQQIEKCNKEISSLKDKNEAWAKKYLRLNEDKALYVNSLQQELEQCRKELSSLKDKDKTWAKKYQCLNEDMAGNMNRHEQQIEKCNKEISSLKENNEAWAKKYLRLNEDKALNVKSLERKLEKCKKELLSLKDKDEAWGKKYLRLNTDKALNMKSLEQQLEKCKKELSSLKDKDEAWAYKYLRLNEDMTITVNSLQQELSSLKETAEDNCISFITSLWAKKYWCLNEDMALNLNSLKQQLEKCTKELSSLKDKDEALVKKWQALNKEFAETKRELNKKIKNLEEANETVGDEILKQRLETEKWKKTAKAIASVLVGNAELCSETSELEPLVSYYTDRAAKRMSSKMFRKATDDCKMATYLDPGRLKARLIAGRCHLVLGEIDEALCCYNKCLNSEMARSDKSLNREASNGLKNAKKVANNIKQSAELLPLKMFESATQAMKIIAEALSVSCYSEKLLKLKGEALFQLHKYEEVVQMCEQTLGIAEKNCGNINDSKCQSDEDPNRHLHLWRWSLMSRSYYRMGKFDMAVATLDKYEQLAPPETMTKGPPPFSAATVRELLRIKTAGNEAFQTGKYREAVEHYSDAIMQSIESRPFTAICLCNRAAAHQALGNVIDAIADCNLAIALDGDYTKAIFRRANLHEKIRDYEEAALDFQRLVCLFEKRSEKFFLDELTIARRQLSLMNIKRKKGMKLDLYLILGLKGSESGSEIKKAYHKAALKHHPDKAGKFLARSESGVDGHVLKEIFTTIHQDADKLFKKIGEAYSVLSDASKRLKYNL
nr:DnaJ domain, zinc finger, CCHC-type, tetratricopeptide-like helical domain protein [Tanacetum cinerariifolium]